jgi:RNA polymerase sigma factor (sigma-70 family)
MRFQIESDSRVIQDSWSDPTRFGLIFDRHVDRIFRLVATRVSRQDAADITADVFERAFRSRHRYDTTYRSAIPWLAGIARNVIGEYFRAKRRNPSFSLAQPYAEFETESVDRICASDAAPRISGALSMLRPAERETFLLYALDGLSYNEISRLMGVAPGTVASRISRARNHILDAEPDLRLSADKPRVARDAT